GPTRDSSTRYRDAHFGQAAIILMGLFQNRGFVQTSHGATLDSPFSKPTHPQFVFGQTSASFESQFQ
ncbi:hypothetical protein MK280_12265, partial [Myxococcota bacterium]|nr:hypothetical protein [Myxococcota bacterium]